MEWEEDDKGGGDDVVMGSEPLRTSWAEEDSEPAGEDEEMEESTVVHEAADSVGQGRGCGGRRGRGAGRSGGRKGRGLHKGTSGKGGKTGRG